MSHAQNMKTLWYISEITPATKGWTARVTVEGKANIHTSPNGQVLQKLVLADAKGDKVEGIIWNKHIKGLQHTLELFKKYEITGAAVGEILPKYRRYSNGLTIQWTLYSDTTTIKACEEDDTKILDSPLKKKSIANMLAFQKDTPTTDLLAVVIGSEQPDYVGKAKNIYRQEITVVNEELTPIRFTLWNKFATEQGSEILRTLHQRPIVLCKDLNVGMYKGLTLQTNIASTVLVQPTTLQGIEFRTWAMKHADDIARLAKQYDDGSLEPVFDTDRIKESIPIADMKEDMLAWTSGRINMVKTDQSCYYIACQKCHTKTAAESGKDFYCENCKTERLSVPWCLLTVQIGDASATVNATTFGKTAEHILGKTADQMASMTKEDIQIHLLDMSIAYDSEYTFALMKASTSTSQPGSLRYYIQQIYKEKMVVEKTADEDTGPASSKISNKKIKGSSSKRQKNKSTDHLPGGSKRKARLCLETKFETDIQRETIDVEENELDDHQVSSSTRPKKRRYVPDIASSPDSTDCLRTHIDHLKSKK